MNSLKELRRHRSLAVVMREYYNSFPPLLISEEAFQKIEKTAALFPVHSSSFWGYEIPLSSSKKAADLLLCIHKADCLKELFLNNPEVNAAIASGGADYEKFRKFSLQWAGNEKKLRETVSNIWFEYDCSAHSDILPTPNFFYAPAEGLNSLALIYITHFIFHTILQQKTEKQAYTLLLKCIELLEGKGWVSQIGMMLARKEQCFRLFIQDMPEFGILPYLKKLNYKFANNANLEAQLHICYKYCKRVDLDIDIHFEVGEKIGLECYLDSNDQAIYFLRMLYANQMCEADKYLMLQDYLENIRFHRSKEFQAFFSHFKLVYSPPAGFTAKAYIGYAESGIARQIIRTKPVKTNLYA